MTVAEATAWIISDGKPGHLNQSIGLAEALQRRLPTLNWQVMPAMSFWQALPFAFKHRRQKPDLIIAAGHRTHHTLLLLAKMLKVPSVVLMKPSLPLAWFDLCIVPKHDSPPIGDNVIISTGVLNKVRPGQKKAGTGLLLIGGPSKHFVWDAKTIAAQIRQVVEQDPRNWVLTTSRRTPVETLNELGTIPAIQIVPHTETDADWLPTMLAQTETCWVTEDSVSMIYEALTAGCRVGLLTLAHCGDNRLTRGIGQLRQQGYLLPAAGKAPLAEADRCANLVIQRLLT